MVSGESKDTDFKLSNNGHDDPEVMESMEDLNIAALNLKKLRRGDGQIVQLGKAELSLLQKMLTAPEEYRETQIFIIADFIDEEEAQDYVAAFYESKDLGMDTNLNVAMMFALAATNRKGNKTNRTAALLDALQHVKYTANTGGNKNGNASKGSPLSG